MNYLRLICALAALLVTAPVYSMEKRPDKTPPPVPPRTYMAKPPSKPLPPIPKAPATPATISNWNDSPLYSQDPQEVSTTIPSSQPRSNRQAISFSSQAVKDKLLKEELEELLKQLDEPAPVAAHKTKVQLSEQEEHSLQKIEQDFDQIILNLTDIMQHAGKFALAAVQLQGHIVLSSVITEGAPIAKDIGSTSLLIANIIIHCRKLSKASPEVRAVAQQKIHTILHSEKFMAVFEKFEKFVESGSAPSFIRTPLQKLAQEIKELPNHIVNAMVKK